MRSAHLILLTAAAVLSLALTAVASGQRPGPVEDGTLSVRDGRASLQLRLKGGVIGRLGRGKLTVVDALGPTRAGRRPRRRRSRELAARADDRLLRGKEHPLPIDRRRALRRQRHAVEGIIDLSGRRRGDGWLDGTATSALNVYFDGSYSLNGSPYKSIPDERDPIQLSALPSGG